MNSSASGNYLPCSYDYESINDNVSCSDCDEDECFASDVSMPCWVIVVCCIYALICLVGAIGNGLVIFVVLRFTKMRSVTNLYICNLAVSDIFFLIGLPLMIVTVVRKTWIFGAIMCKVFYILTSLNWFTSVFILTVMSADRYLAVCHPISSIGYRTPILSRWICVGVWLASMLVMLPVYLYANTESKGGAESCVIRWPHDNTISADKAFIWYAFLVGFTIPVALISIFYTLVVFRLKTTGPVKKSQERKKAHRKVTKMVLIVITAYVICWLPYWIFQVTNTFIDQREWTHTVVHIVTVLSYTNSMLNPVLYAFLAETFRKSFVKALCCASLSDANRTIQVEHSAASGRGGHNRQRDKRLTLELKAEKGAKRNDKETPVERVEKDNIAVEDNQAI